MIFDKSKITEDHLNFLNPYIEKTLDIFNNLSSYKEIDEKTITALDDLHKEAISGALDSINKNKLKTYGKMLLSNPYSSKIKVEKLPAPNLYSVLIFSTLWVIKLSALYIDMWIDEVPEASVNSEGEIDRELVSAKIDTSLMFFGESFFGDRQGRKIYKDYQDYERTPFGSKFMILAAFFWHPYEVNDAIKIMIQQVKEQGENTS